MSAPEADPAPRPLQPTREQVRAARDTTVPDVIDEGLEVLFCGINPGLYSGAVGHHFARPGNRFWKALHHGGLTPEVLRPHEERRLLELGLGITNLVERATAGAAELEDRELREGAERLEAKARRYRPRMVAFLGLTAFRAAYRRPEAGIGLQDLRIGPTSTWLLPNPSGLNAGFRLEDLGARFAELRTHLRS